MEMDTDDIMKDALTFISNGESMRTDVPVTFEVDLNALSFTSTDAANPVTSRSSKRSEDSNEALTVRIHIYDVSQKEKIQKINRVLASRRSPIKFGGVFHAGVEVDGVEWSYGMSETKSGIFCVEPTKHPGHHFRETITLKDIELTPEEVADVLAELREDYLGYEYDLLRQNCCHFADDFCQRLGAGRLPRWVHRLSRWGARVDGTMQAIGL